MQPRPAQSQSDPFERTTQKVEVDLLFTQATKGQPQAMHDLMALAGNEKAEKIERETAIRYLGMHGSVESLVSVAKQLLSIDPGIRTAAYYSLPESARPMSFDYTAKPSEGTRKMVTEAVEKIRQTK